MEAIATLVQHDPYFDVPLSERVEARRQRKERIWASSEFPVLMKSPPIVEPIPEPLLKRGAPPDYGCMWFYNLVFETERKLPLILAQCPGVPQKIRVEQIQAACAKHYGVSRNDIISARRTAAVVRPRQVGYFLAKVLTLKSLPEIGRRFGNRDHSTALSGIRKIERLRKTDKQLDADLHAIAAMVGGSVI